MKVSWLVVAGAVAALAPGVGLGAPVVRDPGPAAYSTASWYGPGFYGRHTASGAVLTPGMLNVAHKRLAFGTRVMFYWRGRRVCAVVNDRGPFIAGREWDLGPGTATALRFGAVGLVGYRLGCGGKAVAHCHRIKVGGAAGRVVRRCARDWTGAQRRGWRYV